MMKKQSDRFKAVDLYEHNIEGFLAADNAFKSGENIIALLRATGTGKTFIFLQLAYEQRDKKVLYIAPSEAIIEHIKTVINDNPNLDINRDFPGLQMWTYQRLVSLTREEIKNIECDFLIIDEFQHLAAPVWGERIKTLVETHPYMKILGMTAYSVSYRGTSYERDMANPDTKELFSGKVCSTYDICDAIIDGVLPKPIYRSAYPIEKIESDIQKIEKNLSKNKLKGPKYREKIETLNAVKKRVSASPSLLQILKKNIKPDGKYIYFCPPYSEKGVNDIETIKKEAFNWFKEFVDAKNIVFYTTTSKMGKAGKKEREAFYNDVTLEGKSAKSKLQVMFAINQYNEGVHAPNVDGVIMGRATTSDIVFFEQLGRALGAKGNTKKRREELEKYDTSKLLEMCVERDIFLDSITSKEEIIDKLVAPIVIDLACNLSFIKNLENNLKSKIKSVQKKKCKTNKKSRKIWISDTTFDIEMENEDIYDVLNSLKKKVHIPWEEYYEIAKIYYEHNHDLLVPEKFKTNDGYTEDSDSFYLLGNWINKQRQRFSSLPKEKQEKLLALDFVLNVREAKWNENYKKAAIYFQYWGDLLIPHDFITSNGYEFDENGEHELGKWLFIQRRDFSKFTKERQGKLLAIGFELSTYEALWERNYRDAETFFRTHGHLQVKPNDKIYTWVVTQRKEFPNYSKERQEKLLKIGLKINVRKTKWEEYYELAKNFYEHRGHLIIPKSFITNDGFTQDANGKYKLGEWIVNQRRKFLKLEKEKQDKLLAIGFILDVNKEKWEIMYNLAKTYYEHYGHLVIPPNFKTNDGVTKDQNGEYNLGRWISNQRVKIDPSSERGKRLLQIGMVFSVKKNNEEIKLLCLDNSIDYDKNKHVLEKISKQELYSKLEFLKSSNLPYVDENGCLAEIFSMSNARMQSKYNVSLEELVNEYYLNNSLKRER